MPGASENTRRVKIMNANWNAGQAGDDGRFELMLVTRDDERHILEPSPAALTALVALAQAETVLVWDPDNRTLIAANLRGTMPWTERLEEQQAQAERPSLLRRAAGVLTNAAGRAAPAAARR
jgi:hypothetical protein